MLAMIGIKVIIGSIIVVAIYTVSQLQQKKRLEKYESGRNAAEAAYAATNKPHSDNPIFDMNVDSANTQTNSN